MYHGSLKDRRYWDRNFIFDGINDNIHDLIILNECGVFEWKTQDLVDHWNPIIWKYFKHRNDDNDTETEKKYDQLKVADYT